MLEMLYLQNHILKLINCVLIIASVEKEHQKIVQSNEILAWVHYDRITVSFRDDSVFGWSGSIQKLPPRQHIYPL